MKMGVFPRKAFATMELPVVITILFLLCVILFSGVHRIREVAKKQEVENAVVKLVEANPGLRQEQAKEQVLQAHPDLEPEELGILWGLVCPGLSVFALLAIVLFLGWVCHRNPPEEETPPAPPSPEGV